MANVNVLSLIQTVHNQWSLAKQALEANDKTTFQTISTAIGVNKTAIDAAISAATNINDLQGLR